MSKNKKTSEPAAHKRSAPMFLMGAVLLVIGFFTIMGSKRVPGGLDWLWWVGLAIEVVGGHLLFFSGMSREHMIEWLRSEVFALTLALLIRWPIAEPYRIPSGSMAPTLHGDARMFRGDRVFVNKWVYGVRFPFMNKRIWAGAEPKRWDIVVFKAVPENAEHATLVKRIVGMPGERIEIRDGKVFANGEALDIPDFMPVNQYYTSPGYPDWHYGLRPEDKYAVVPEGHYLVLGDNSGNSKDGRYFGWLPNDHIVGRVAAIWWPPSSWRDFTGFTETLWWRASVSLLFLLLFTRLFIGRSWAMLVPAEAGANNTRHRVDHLFINFLAFGFRVPFTRIRLLNRAGPARGEQVLYYVFSEATPDGEPLFGRVAGLPGERVLINDGKLHIDGNLLEGPDWPIPYTYTMNNPKASYGRAKGKARNQVPEGHYFILADPDNGDLEPVDSRIVGWVPHSGLIGRAAAVWWPLWRARAARR